jgi:tripartite ATP-independent transporter DctM subunit
MEKKKPAREHKSVLWIIEEGFCYLSFACLAMLPASEAAARLVFRTGIPSSALIMIHLLLLAGLFAGMITTRQEKHLAIGIVQYFSSEKIKRPIAVIANLLSAFVTTIIAWASFPFIRYALSPWRMIGFIPDQIFALIIPISFGVMAFRFARLTPVTGAARILPVLSVVLGTAAAFPVIAKFIWGFDTPDLAYDIIDQFYALSYYIRIPVVILFVTAALAGTPLFVVMGGLAIVLIQSSWVDIDVIPIQIYSALTQDSIIAIPLFTLVGFFLSESKAGERLVQAFRCLFSWLPGGLIIATVIICAFFTSFTGASGVTILALGGILFTVLSGKGKYPENFTVGLLTSVGGIGLLFPPSLPIILVGATTQTNIVHLFLGGLFPGLILVIVMIVFGIIASVKTKIPVEPFNLKDALHAFRISIWEIFLPFLLIAGYFTGILSLVEIGAAALVYTFVIEVFVHRDIAIRDIPKVVFKAVPIIGGVLSILALSQALSYYIVDTQAPMNLARWMQSAISSKFVFLLLLNFALLLVGCLMDIFSAILIVLPLAAPLGQVYGIEPVHLGIIFITNLELGFLTPPVGLNLFLATYRFERPFVEICRNVFSFLLVQVVVVILVTYVPWLSTYLTRFF